MKYQPVLLLAFLLLFTACSVKKLPPPPPITDEAQTDQQCYRNGTLSVEERNRIYPFNKAKQTELLLFTSDEVPVRKKRVDTSFVKECVVLNTDQINTLTDILYNYNYSLENRLIVCNEVACSNPSCAIVFKYNAGKVIGFIQLDFYCERVITNLPDKSLGVFCEGKLELLETFFAEAGIIPFGNEYRYK